MFKELFESLTLVVDISDLKGVDNETEVSEFDDLLKNLTRAGLKNKDWSYKSDDEILIPVNTRLEKILKSFGVPYKRK